MATDQGVALLTVPWDHARQVGLLLYAGGPVLLCYHVTDPGTDITNPGAVTNPPQSYLCALSGFPIRDGDETRKLWTGETVLSRFWEPRHPQDLIRARPELVRTTDATGAGPDQFIGTDRGQVTADEL